MPAKHWSSVPHPPGTEIPMHTPEALERVLKLAGPVAKSEEDKMALVLVADLLAGYKSAKDIK